MSNQHEVTGVTYRDKPADARDHDVVPGFSPVTWGDLKSNQQAPRPLHVIAREIISTWPKPYFGAVPYIEAMRHLVTMDSKFGHDSADDIVMYFLSNAKYWRGEDAKRIKNELNSMLPKRYQR